MRKTLNLDKRIGSIELGPYFAAYGIKPDVGHLDFGDIAFSGHGPHGECHIGIERKRITDLIQSINSKRLSGFQLPGMAETFDYVYLVVEGLWRPGENDELEIRNGHWSNGPGRSMTYRAVDSYLTTLEVRAGLIYRRTATPRETVAIVVNLFRWWQDKQWQDHKSHQAIYAPADPIEGRRMSLISRKPTLVERVACQLPGIDSKARNVAKKFGSVREMALADEKAWMEVEGVGRVGAKRILEAITDGRAR